MICRDRAGAYADGAAKGAPQAIQVADRCHLWKNLIGYVEKTVARHRADLPEPEAAIEPAAATEPHGPAKPPAGPAAQREPGRIVARTEERHAAIRQRLDLGQNLTTIARELGLSRATVRRFARAGDPGELLAASAPASSMAMPATCTSGGPKDATTPPA